jgi:hypothetical protein
MTRNEEWKRISAMAGLDEEGGVLPPSIDGGIDRRTNPWWRTRVWQRDQPKREAE